MKFKDCVFLDEAYDNIQIRRSADGGGVAVRMGYALHSVMSKEARTTKRGTGDVSPFSALMTALAAGGPGALVWMEISAPFGITSKFSECMLAVKYREANEKGEMSGGPMYVMKKALGGKFGQVLGFLFALFAVIASFGIGDMKQANSIASSINSTFAVPNWITGGVITVLSLIIVIGGIKSISKVSSMVVPVMAIFYLIAGLIVIFGNISALPGAIAKDMKEFQPEVALQKKAWKEARRPREKAAA